MFTQSLALVPKRNKTVLQKNFFSLFSILGIATFCSSKPNGIHADPDDRSSFIVCYNGETEERRCPLELKFNPREKLCDLPVEGFSSGRGFIRSKYGHMHNLVKAYRGMPSRQLNLIEKRFKANKLFDKRRRLRRLRYRLIRKN